MVKRRVTDGGEIRWDVRLRYPDGRQYSKTFRSKKEAERYRATELADRARGNWIDPQAGQITFSDWADEWLEAMVHTWRPRTTEKHRLAVDVHWRPRFGHQSLDALSPRQIQAAVNELALSHRPSSVRTYYGTLRSALRFAVERDVIGRSPCRSIKLPAAEPSDKRVLEVGELHRLAGHVDDRWRCMIYLAGVLGLRFGEVVALRVIDLDLGEREELRIRRTLTEAKGAMQFGEPKSSASVRTLALPRPLSVELREHIGRYRLSGDELMFTSRGGRPLRRSRFRNEVFAPAVEAAGLHGLTFHGLRHSAATSWVAQGIDLRTVQAWLGHADPQLVLRLYAHATDSASRRSAEILTASYWPADAGGES